MKLDEETLSLAELALRNEFYREYSALVNKFMEVGEGLDDLEDQLQTMSNVYSRDLDAESDLSLNNYMQDGRKGDSGYDHITDALESGYREIYVCSKRYFELRGGEYWYVGDNN